MNLLASYSWAVDVAFFAILLIGVFAGVAAGFARCFSKIIGTVVSVIFAGAYCVNLSEAFEILFGLKTAIYGAIGSVNLTNILSAVIAFVALVIVIRLLVWVVGHIASALVSRGGAISVIDRVLGAMAGGGIAFALVFLILSIISWIDIGTVNEFISESTVVRSMFHSFHIEAVFR